MFIFAYVAEVVWFCPVSRPRVISKSCLGPRAAVLPSSPPLPGGREAAQLLRPETPVLRNQMLPVTSFWPLGGATRAVGLLFPMPTGICSCWKGYFFFLLFCIYSTGCGIFIGYALVLYTLIRIPWSGLWIFVVPFTALFFLRWRFSPAS